MKFLTCTYGWYVQVRNFKFLKNVFNEESFFQPYDIYQPLNS